MRELMVGRELWVLTPKTAIIPGRIKVTRAAVYYPASGLVEERITLEEASPSDVLEFRRRK